MSLEVKRLLVAVGLAVLALGIVYVAGAVMSTP